MCSKTWEDKWPIQPPFYSLITKDEWSLLPQILLADGNKLVGYSFKILLEYILIFPLSWKEYNLFYFLIILRYNS